MTKIYKKLKLTNGTKPYSYEWFGTPCTKFITKKGTTDEYVETEIELNTCSFPFDVIIKVKDANKCEALLTMSIDDPCLLEVAEIIEEGYLTFSILANNSSNITYEWTFPPQFTTTDSTYSTLQLKPKSFQTISYNTNYVISCKVTDFNGCEVLKQFTFRLCSAITNNGNIQSLCNTSDNVCGVAYESSTASVNINNYITKCPNTFIDLAKDLFVTPIPPLTLIANSIGSLFFCLPDNDIPEYSFNYYVIDSLGIKSNTSKVIITTAQCSNPGNCYTFNATTLDINCSEIQTTNPFYTWTSQITNNPNFDWNTFTMLLPNGNNTGSQVTSLGTYTIVNQYELDTPYGSLVLTGNHELVYTIDTLPTSAITETLKWRICDFSNCCSNDVMTSYVHQCTNSPVAVNDTVCAVCGQVSIINPIVNDQGVIQSIIITQNPANGIATANGTFINYTPNTNYTGTDIIKYRAVDNNTNQSNEATITVTVNCAGQPQQITTC